MKGRLALIEQRGTEYGRGRSHGATFDIHLIREGELILNRIMMDSEVVIALSRGGRGRKFFIGTVCGVESRKFQMILSHHGEKRETEGDGLQILRLEKRLSDLRASKVGVAVQDRFIFKDVFLYRSVVDILNSLAFLPHYEPFSQLTPHQVPLVDISNFHHFLCTKMIMVPPSSFASRILRSE